MEPQKAMRLYRRLWIRCVKNISEGPPDQRDFWLQEAKAAKVKWAQARKEHLGN